MLHRNFFLFNTLNSVSAETDDEKILDEVLALCKRYENLFSHVNPESQLYGVNRAKGRPLSVDPELAALVKTALAYCRESEGRYDITMGSVTRLWDFKRGIIPDAAEVSQALKHVNYHTVCVQNGEISLDDPLACIDLGGIAKGYIADAILALLREHGIDHALVNLGGNVAVMGGKHDGKPWRVGIRKPLPSGAMSAIESFATVAIHEGSVVTSGIYERAFTREDVLYHHILDPKTGFPAHTDLLSATVISRTSIEGDGFTTALIIMGADRALEFTCEHPEIEAILVTRDGDVLATPGVGNKIPFEIIS